MIKMSNKSPGSKSVVCSLVLGCDAYDGAVCVDSGRGDDGRFSHLHPSPRLLSLGGVLHHLHRDWSSRLHDLLERQSRLHLHDQSHHVHWVLNNDACVT